MISKDGRFLFVPMFSFPTPLPAITTYEILPDGSLVDSQTRPLNKDPEGLAEHPSLPVLCVTGGDELVTYSIAADGTLSPLPGTTPLAVAVIHEILIDPTETYLYAFGVFSGGISSFTIEADGSLTPLEVSLVPASR